MKSNKQRKSEIQEHSKKRATKASVKSKSFMPADAPIGTVPCNPYLLAPYNSYGAPRFVECGYYADLSFTCRDCRKQEIWKATQQKWWYEIAKGNVETCATRCRQCRKIERERKAEARRVHLEGLAKKQARQ
jgi:hypothetical protein